MIFLNKLANLFGMKLLELLSRQFNALNVALLVSRLERYSA